MDASVRSQGEGSDGMELDARPAHVLAFGSQLLFGSVGLNAALPVYHAAGVRSIAVPTVLLSNLPHYADVHRVALSATYITESLRNLETIGALDDVRVVAVGYLADAAQGAAIAAWFRHFIVTRPEPPVLILDPSFGDADVGFYTDPGVVAALQGDLLPLAVGITPNRFELGHLTGIPAARLVSAGEMARAGRSVLTSPSGWVIVTGGLRNRSRTTVEVECVTNTLIRSHDQVDYAHARVDRSAKGQGDVFVAALICGLLAGQSIETATQGAARVVQDVLRRRTLHRLQPPLQEGPR